MQECFILLELEGYHHRTLSLPSLKEGLAVHCLAIWNQPRVAVIPGGRVLRFIHLPNNLPCSLHQCPHPYSVAFLGIAKNQASIDRCQWTR